MIRFADTFYFLALLNPRDSAHRAAVANSVGPFRTVTTEWVLTELADAMAIRSKRQAFTQFYLALTLKSAIEIVPSSAALFAAGINLFSARPDKDWSLTDCLSFIVMEERGITEALTGDHHFEQAGFTALLR